MRKLDETWFSQIDEIMQEAFPIEERRMPKKQYELFSLPYYQVYGMIEADQVVSFLAVWEFDDFIFGEHLASAACKRGSGIGKELLQAYQKDIDKPIFFEVEKDISEIAKRRIAFYKRLGFTLYDHIPYAQPSFHDGTPVPLYIMSDQENLQDVQLKSYINLIYKHVYGKQEPWNL